LFIVLVAVVLALIFFAAIAAAGIFLFVRRRNQRSADTAPAQQPFAESQ
jgi:hypothetical protein